MKQLCILIVIDVNAALASGSPIGNAYLVDDYGFLGSWQEGTEALHTVCQDGQMITWNVVPISPNSTVAITGFSGDMVGRGVCTPVLQQGADPPYWSGRVASRGQFASFGYTVGLSLAGTAMSLSAFIKTV